MSSWNILDLSLAAPWRPVDWRWKRAVRLREAGRIAPTINHRGDVFLRRALDFLTAWDRCQSDWDFERLCGRWPALAQARNLRDSPEKESLRWEVEARLLARQTPEEIAGLLYATADTIAWYEALWFNVTDRLDSLSWVVHHALGRDMHYALRDNDTGTLWRYYGYAGGRYVLDAALSLGSGHPAEGPDAVQAYHQDEARFVLSRKLHEAALTLRTGDPFVKMQLVELQTKWLAMQKEAASGTAGEQLMQHVQAVLGGLSWQVARALPAPGRHAGPGGAYAHLAAEPRAAELIAAAAGRGPDPKELEGWDFPQGDDVVDGTATPRE